MMVVGLNIALTPLGTPLALNATLCATPLVICVLTATVPEFPESNTNVVGFVDIEKSFAAVTVRLTVVLCTIEPVPVMVTGTVPSAALEVAVSVNVELPPDVIVDGVNTAFTPLGRPLTPSATLCALPCVIAVETETVPLPP